MLGRLNAKLRVIDPEKLSRHDLIFATLRQMSLAGLHHIMRAAAPAAAHHLCNRQNDRRRKR
jgi:hypothetical protein